MIAPLRALPSGTRRLLVAYSGGRDSTALLHALAHGAPGAELIAVHVCHHLDPNSAAWAAHCAAFAASLGVPLRRLDVTVDIKAGGLEAAARKSRYQAIASLIEPGDVVVSAHHARDQAETVLIQAIRGAGMRGLAAMPALAPLGAGRLWRPWRQVDPQAIAAYVADHGLAFVDDPSNADVARERGWLAHTIWPAIAARRPGTTDALCRVAERAAEAAEAVDALAAIDLDSARAEADTLSIAALASLTRARATEVLRRWLAERGAARPDHRHLAECLRLLAAREHAGPRVVFGASEVRRFDARLFVMPRLAPAADFVIDWPRPQAIALPGDAGRLGLAADSHPDHWPAGLSVASRRGGERMSRADGSRYALKDWLREQRIAPWVRRRLPLVYAGETLVAVADRWVCPDWHSYFGGASPRLEWRHALAGDPFRVVGPRPIG